MPTLLHTSRGLLLAALLLATGSASAQLAPALPLAADPARAAYAPPALPRPTPGHRPAALALPFFDDFTSPLEGPPRADRWQPTGGALVSNRFAIQPLTRGAATLDGLRANGRSYSNAITSSYGAIDSLTSQPIDLSGLTTNDQVYLSFAWQAGSIVGVPNLNIGSNTVRLQLFAKTSGGSWQLVWTQLSKRQRTPFRQQVISLNGDRYLHESFQFMFIASGNRSDNSDGWSVDYVLLDKGRTQGLADTTFADVATSAGLLGSTRSGGLRSPLRRFAAMPVWQFNAASPPGSELNPHLGVNVTNLSPGALPIPTDIRGSVRDQSSGAELGPWLQTTRALPTNPRLDSVTGAASRQAVPTTPNTKTLRYTLFLNSQETNTLTLPNDTIYRDVELNNYYAYDDGTAENVTQLTPYATGQPSAFAYRFDLNQPDYVRSLRLYPVFTASDAGSRPVTISVWNDEGGKPAAEPSASKSAVIPNPLPVGSKYYEITFDAPVRVADAFYVGYSQPSQGRNLHYGLDLNSTFPTGHLWRRDNASIWDTVNFVPRGALMMRPVMTNTVTTATVAAYEAQKAFSLYPNPAHGTVTVAGPAFARAALFDALGRAVWEQPAAQAGKPTLVLPDLLPGVYAIRLTLTDGHTIGQRLMIQ